MTMTLDDRMEANKAERRRQAWITYLQIVDRYFEHRPEDAEPLENAAATLGIPSTQAKIDAGERINDARDAAALIDDATFLEMALAAAEQTAKARDEYRELLKRLVDRLDLNVEKVRNDAFVALWGACDFTDAERNKFAEIQGQAMQAIVGPGNDLANKRAANKVIRDRREARHKAHPFAFAN